MVDQERDAHDDRLHEDWLDEKASSAAIYLLRTTQQHHVQLSAMADLKANILITASSILLSVSIGLSSTDVGFRPSLAVLGLLTMVGLAFAVFAVLPKYWPGRRLDPKAPTFNLLFFGHFSKISPEEFTEEILDLTTDYEKMVRTQAKDIYELGAYLEKYKYRFLRYAYAFFLAGLVLGGAVEAFTQLT